MDGEAEVVPGAGAEGAPAGGVTGPGETPPGAADPNPEPGSAGAGAPPDDGGEESPFDRRAGASGARRGADNPIPYSRVKQMLARAAQEAEQRAEVRFRQQMEPVLKQLNPEAIRAGIAESMLQSLGYQPKKPEPKFVTEETMQRLLGERDAKYQSDLTRQQEETQASREIEAAKGANKDLFEAYPDLEEDCANLWASRWAVENKVSMAQVVAYKVKTLRAAIGKLNATYAEQKEGDRQVPTPMRPGGGATPRAGKKANLGTEEGAANAALELLRKAGVK